MTAASNVDTNIIETDVNNNAVVVANDVTKNLLGTTNPDATMKEMLYGGKKPKSGGLNMTTILSSMPNLYNIFNQNTLTGQQPYIGG